MGKVAVNLDPVSLGLSLFAKIGSLFGSKKHHAVYYWEPADGLWKFAYTGQLPKAKAVETEYKKAGYFTALVRDKNNTAKPPTAPPVGYVAPAPAGGGGTGINLWIMAGIAGVGLLAFFLLGRRRRA